MTDTRRSRHEPRFARIASMIGDATRARMLAHLLDGRHATANELARAVDVTPPTASAHLAKLVDHGLLTVRSQGRHRYFRIADGDVAHALEALSLVAERDEPGALARVDAWNRPDRRPLREARTCYGHLAGRLGVALHDALLANEVVTPGASGHAPGPAASAWLASVGIDVAAVRHSRRGIVYPCVDWSERRDHFAGPLAAALLERFVAQRWLTRVDGSRALAVNPVTRARFERLLG